MIDVSEVEGHQFSGDSVQYIDEIVLQTRKRKSTNKRRADDEVTHRVQSGIIACSFSALLYFSTDLRSLLHYMCQLCLIIRSIHVFMTLVAALIPHTPLHTAVLVTLWVHIFPCFYSKPIIALNTQKMENVIPRGLLWLAYTYTWRHIAACYISIISCTPLNQFSWNSGKVHISDSKLSSFLHLCQLRWP